MFEILNNDNIERFCIDLKGMVALLQLNRAILKDAGSTEPMDIKEMNWTND